MPLTVDSFNAPFERAEREAEQAQHRHDACRDIQPQSRRQRIVALRQALENADEWLAWGRISERDHSLLVHDMQEELAVLRGEDTI